MSVLGRLLHHFLLFRYPILQILWERGKIDIAHLKEYSMTDKLSHKDPDGKVRPELQKYVLMDLMASCADFQQEKSAMEDLCNQLSSNVPCRISILTTPKYHCEIAGMGVELAWGLSKRKFRSTPLEQKKGRATFNAAVKASIEHVKKHHVKMFTAKIGGPCWLTFIWKKGVEHTRISRRSRSSVRCIVALLIRTKVSSRAFGEKTLTRNKNYTLE